MPECPRCGSIVEETDRYCPYCGYSLKPAPYIKTMKSSRNWVKWVGVTLAIIMVLAIVGVALRPQMSPGSTGGVGFIQPQTYPDIRVVEVYAKTYLAGLDVRAIVKATLYNYGTANGYAIVRLYTKWDTTRDEATVSAYVPMGQYVTVQADLDVPAFGSWRYGADVISQSKA